MEEIVQKTLTKGVEMHVAGKFEAAGQLYESVIKLQPNHADANHNMGLLKVDMGDDLNALSYLQTALEADTSIVEFWLSYIKALIKLKRMGEASRILSLAKESGLADQGFFGLQQRLAEPPTISIIENSDQSDKDTAQPNILDTLKLDKALRLAKQKFKDGSLQEAKRIYQDILTKFPKNKNAIHGMKALSDASIVKESSISEPTQDQFQPLVNLYNQGHFQQVVCGVAQLLKKFPKSINLYNIQGAANSDLGLFYDALKSYEKALSIKPDYVEAYFNMGVILQEQGKLEKAMDAYKKVLSIKPDYTKAYSNMGVILQEQGKLEEAIKAYSKLLSLKSDNATAHSNMGAIFQKQGKLQEAIKAFNKALSIKPDYIEAWNNIAFPLQAIKTQKLTEQELSVYHLENTLSKRVQIQKSILNYRVHLGEENLEKFFQEALSTLSSAENITILNPTFNENCCHPAPALLEKVIGLVHFGRSGTGLLHSLIDGHPEVSSLPSIYFSEYFDQSNWEKIISSGWSKMADRFIMMYEVLFDASSSVPIPGKRKKVILNIGQKEGMANVGNQGNEVLNVDKALFRLELNRLMDFYNELDAYVFFKLIHTAFDKALNDRNKKALIFYHIHNPDTYAQLNFVRLNPTGSWVMMVRDPIQSCESWVLKDFNENKYDGIAEKIFAMLFEVDSIIYSEKASIGVRLEDLKERPRQTIPALCNWIGIEETASFYEMTAQGKKWWGDPNSPDYKKDGMDPFGQTSIKRKVGSVFSENDQFILRTLFYPFSIRFGYVEENLEQFKVDLQTIRPMLDQLFDFEKTIVERTNADPKQFAKSGPYLYLRSGLIERWNTLNKFQTYPNLIKPLDI